MTTQTWSLASSIQGIFLPVVWSYSSTVCSDESATDYRAGLSSDTSSS
ncbi:hypothetical protein [Tsukamurella soli]